MTEFGIKFKTARENARDTQMDVAVKLGCSLSTISKIEINGKAPQGRAILRNANQYIKEHAF